MASRRDEERPRTDRPSNPARRRARRDDDRPGRPPRPGGRRDDDRSKPDRPGRPPRAGGRRDDDDRSKPDRPGRPPRAGGRRDDDRSRAGRPARGTTAGSPVADERTKGWGGVARRGTRNLQDPKPGSAADAWRKAAEKADRDRGRPPAWGGDGWSDGGRVARTGAAAAPSPKRRRSPVPALPPDVADELGRGASGSGATRDHERLQEAATAYARERYRDARALLVPLAERVPGATAVRELLGLTYYRMGRWRDAIRELEAYARLTGSVDQHPVLADAHRALGHHEAVERLWDELRRTGAGVETVIEGRIVLAGDLADRGDVAGAIKVLEEGPVEIRRPQEHHVRLWYALAAMYERAGDPTRARALFARLVHADPSFADAAARLDALS